MRNMKKLLAALIAALLVLTLVPVSALAANKTWTINFRVFILDDSLNTGYTYASGTYSKDYSVSSNVG